MDVIDLNTERNRREQPDAGCMKADDFGQPMYLFALQYQFDGKTWAAEIWAYSWDDAEARVAAMRESLAIVGQTYSVIPL